MVESNDNIVNLTTERAPIAFRPLLTSHEGQFLLFNGNNDII